MVFASFVPRGGDEQNIVLKQMAKDNAKKQKRASISTREPVNADALRDIASRKASADTCWDGSNVPIREVILHCLGKVKDGFLYPKWRECDNDCGEKTRRYCAGESLFRLPRALRAIGRSGLENCLDLDQCNAHPHAQLSRHPGRIALMRYVSQREEVLKEVCDACGVSRSDAKNLFLRQCDGGTLAK